MSRQDDSAPYAQGFHPEFGYLCPSTALKRRAGQALKLGIAAMAVFAGAAFGLSSVLTTSPAPQSAHEELVAARPVASPDPSKPAMPLVRPDTPVQVASVPTAPEQSAVSAVPPGGAGGLAHAQASCTDLSEAFLSPQCQTTKKSRARTAETASRHAAGATLGRTDTAPEAAPRSALPRKVARERVPADAVAPEKGVPSVKAASDEAAPHSSEPVAATAAGASPDDPAAAPEKPKKPVRTARKRSPRDDATIAAAPPAPAPASQPSFGLFSFFRDLARNVSGPSTASWQ